MHFFFIFRTNLLAVDLFLLFFFVVFFFNCCSRIYVLLWRLWNNKEVMVFWGGPFSCRLANIQGNSFFSCITTLWRLPGLLAYISVCASLRFEEFRLMLRSYFTCLKCPRGTKTVECRSSADAEALCGFLNFKTMKKEWLFLPVSGCSV